MNALHIVNHATQHCTTASSACKCPPAVAAEAAAVAAGQIAAATSVAAAAVAAEGSGQRAVVERQALFLDLAVKKHAGL